MSTNKNNTKMHSGRDVLIATVLKYLISLALILIPSHVLAQRAGEVCDDRCLLDRYEEMFERAEANAKQSRKADEDDLLRDIAKNPDFFQGTKNILRKQIKEGFSQFDFPNPTEAPATGKIPKLTPISFRRIVVPDSLGGIYNQDCSGGGLCEFPNPYDIKEDWVHLVYKLNTLSVAEVTQYFNQEQGKFLLVYMNGLLLIQGQGFGENTFHSNATSNCGSAQISPCMVVFFGKNAWYHAPQPPWPVWNVKIEFWQVGRAGNEPTKQFEVLTTVVPPPNLASYWLTTIGQTVISGRCTTCHTMDTPQKIIDRHNTGINLGAGNLPFLVPSLLVPGQSVHFCSNCHNNFLSYLTPLGPFPEHMWATPTVAQNINWADLVNNNPLTWPTVICQTMKTNLNTPALRHQHFHEDARLFWAVAKGELPPPLPGVLPTAPPHNYTKFLERFDKWNDNGALCP